MKSITDIKLIQAWVDVDFPVEGARHLMRGYGVPAMPVCDGSSKIVGLVTFESLASADGDAKVQDYIAPKNPLVDSSMQVRDVAKKFLSEGIDFATVVNEDGERLGFLTSRMLLGELNRSYDPLTGLSWSDYLRSWGVEHLERHQEVTIIFVDLDEFGQYNKKYGHIIGDRVLQSVSERLEKSLDPSRDILVRYGGDEFAIGTLRLRDEAEEFAKILEENQDLASNDEFGQPVAISVGVFGGKRTKEREVAHFSATLDNLINLASKAALAHKKAKKEGVPDQVTSPVGQVNAPMKEDSIRVAEVMVDESQPDSLTTVTLSHEGTVVSGVSARGGGSVSMSVATATGKALERIHSGMAIRIEDVRLNDGGDGKREVAVDVSTTDGNRFRRGSATSDVGEGIFDSTAKATVAAFLQSTTNARNTSS